MMKEEYNVLYYSALLMKITKIVKEESDTSKKIKKDH